MIEVLNYSFFYYVIDISLFFTFKYYAYLFFMAVKY